ncbi:hypothetical protein AQUCO_02800209v1 [Aquilegia coerulea]|uniref:Cystatin domain-containing protein n=1 Tax=Aquilegia coerulea TaxID=218851 RepID=A0A2G5D4C2_AQUCA|nr:hypothetical protein AQUCO_02800209v1 [Aquilegia coerulea]
MKTTQSSLLLLLVVIYSLISTFALSPAPSHGAVVGGYKIIKDLKEPYIQDLSKFVVLQYNKQEKSNLKYVNVIKGQMKVVAGVNYRLVIAAKRDGKLNIYLAVVYVRAGGNKKALTSFHKV